MKYEIETKNYGKYDVVVCGGGTSGCFAAIAAARNGAKTILIERSFTVGGMLTVGNAGITKFTEHCKDVDKYKKEVLDVLATDPKKVQVVGGIPHEYVMRMIKNGVALGTKGESGSYVFTEKSEAQITLIEMLTEAGVEILYDTRVCTVSKNSDRIDKIIVCNKDGFGEISAEYVIDCTGDADVAAFAGVPCNKGATEADIASGGAKKVGEMQSAGIMIRVRGVDFDRLFKFLEENPDRFYQHEFGVMSLENAKTSYYNGEMSVFRVLAEVRNLGLRPVQVYNLPQKGEAILLGIDCGTGSIDALDARTLSNGQNFVQLLMRKFFEYIVKVPGFEKVQLTYAPDIGVRESRHIIGEYTITELDVVSGRDFEDSIACGGHPVDIHPIPDEIKNMSMDHWRFHIPYRIMIPKNIDNLLVAGRSVSATRIASGAIRPTAQCMAMGEAAGTAAAILTNSGLAARDIDINTLRERLKNNGAVI